MMNQNVPIKDIPNSIECIADERNKKLKQPNNNKRRPTEKQKERINCFLWWCCDLKKTLFCCITKESP